MITRRQLEDPSVIQCKPKCEFVILRHWYQEVRYHIERLVIKWTALERLGQAKIFFDVGSGGNYRLIGYLQLVVTGNKQPGNFFFRRIWHWLAGKCRHRRAKHILLLHGQ